MRAGGRTLTLLGAPRTFLILRSLEEGTKGQFELRRDAGSPAQSTLRSHLSTLEGIGAIERQRRDAFPGALEYNLTGAGRELLEVAAGLECWLKRAPQGPLQLGDGPAKAAIKGLVEGWTAGVLTTLASGPLSLTQLDKQISTVTYPAIERCLETMRLAEQLKAGMRDTKGTPYMATDWLRRGLVPLVLAARWEHHHQPEGADPIRRDDIDAAIAVGAPLVSLPAKLSGTWQLTVKTPSAEKGRYLAAVEIRQGQLVFRGVYPQVKPDAWASGTVDTWFATVIDADTSGLKMRGDSDFALTVLDGLREAMCSDLAEASEEPAEAEADAEQPQLGA